MEKRWFDKHQLVMTFWLSLLAASCSMSSGTANTASQSVVHDYRAEIKSTSEHPLTRLEIRVEDQGRPADFNSGQSMLHAHVLPTDSSTLYHEHPTQVNPGEFILDSPVTQTGDYDLWLEITSSGHGHVVNYLQRFSIKLRGTDTRRPDVGAVRLTPQRLALKSAGNQSELEYIVLNNDSPVERFGSFVGVEVHGWAVSLDRTFLVHEHADILGQGRIRLLVTFPRPGDYVIFVQPSIPSADGQLLPMLRQTVTIEP